MMAFLLLGIGYLLNASGGPNESCIKAGGAFGILAAFLAWYGSPNHKTPFPAVISR